MTRIRVTRVEKTTFATPGNKLLLNFVQKHGKPEIVVAHRGLSARYSVKATQPEQVINLMVDDAAASLMFNVPLYRASA